MIPSRGRREAGGSAMEYDSPLRRHLREALSADPAAAYRDWFRAQEELRESGEAEAARALADDLWDLLPSLPFFEDAARARFFHNVGVFSGSRGRGWALAGAGRSFAGALAHSRPHDESGWRARPPHTLATAVASLGTPPAELAEAVAL